MKRFLFLSLLLLTPVFVQAAPVVGPGGNSAPVQIDAGESLEWLRSDNMYRATKDVVITQGDTVLKSDTAEAHYDAAAGPSSLTEIILTGHVVMTTGTDVKQSTAIGDKAVYDTRTQIMTLTGAHVQFTSGTTVVKANKQMTYDAATHKATASGGAIVEQPDQVLRAQNVTAWLGKDGKGLERADAQGDVTITRGNKAQPEVAQSQKAHYDAKNKKITLDGDVKITRGDNHMQGARATMDLQSGQSALVNDPAHGGRVHAVFSSASTGGATAVMPMVPGKQRPEAAYQVQGTAPVQAPGLVPGQVGIQTGTQR